MAIILVLDDDTRFRRLAASILEARGHTVIEAPNGRSAMSIAESQKLDLAIVDFRLPDIDGVQWITWFRDRSIMIPVIFLSGFHCDERMLNRLRNVLNVSLVLQKPIEPGAFSDQVEDVLQEADRKFKSWLGVRTRVGSEPARVHHDEDCFVRDWEGACDHAAAETQCQEGIPADDLELDLDTLMRDYASQLPRILKDIGDLITLAETDPDLFGLIDSIIDRLHKVRGTAGSYNQPAVGELAGKMEDILQLVQKDEKPLSPQIWDEIKLLLQQAITKAESCNGETTLEPVVVQMESSVIPVISTEREEAPRFLVDKLSSCVAVDQPIIAETADTIDSAPLEVAAKPIVHHRLAMLLFDTNESRAQQLISVARNRALRVETIKCADDAAQALSDFDVALAVINASPETAIEAMAIVKVLHDRSISKSVPIVFSTQSFSLHERALAAQTGVTLCLDEPLTVTKFDRIIQQLFKSVDCELPRVMCLGADEEALTAMANRLNQDGINAWSLSDTSDVLKSISSFQPHLVLLLEVSNAGFSGIDICRAIRDSESFRDIAVVFYTGNSNSRVRLAATKAGADDFIAAGTEWAAVSTKIGRLSENAKLRMARFGSDALAGLLLPSSIMHRLDSLLSDCQLDQTPFTVCRVVISNLQKIDVLAGYESVNEALRIVGTIVTLYLRDQAVCGRCAGEFILAFPRQDRTSVLPRIEELMALFGSVTVQCESREAIELSANYTIASYPVEALTLTSLLDCLHVSPALACV